MAFSLDAAKQYESHMKEVATSLRCTASDPIVRARAKEYSKKKALREMTRGKTLESMGRLNFSSDHPCAFRIRYDPSIKAIDFDAIERSPTDPAEYPNHLSTSSEPLQFDVDW